MPLVRTGAGVPARKDGAKAARARGSNRRERGEFFILHPTTENEGCQVPKSGILREEQRAKSKEQRAKS
jgi:hypothetical protein